MKTRLRCLYLPAVCAWVDEDVAEYHGAMHDDVLVISKLTDAMETQWLKNQGLPWGRQKDVMAQAGLSDKTKQNNETKPMKNILMNEASDETVTTGTTPGEAVPSEATAPVPVAQSEEPATDTPASEEAPAAEAQAPA